MLKLNSFFMRILIPVLAVMLLQTLLISMILQVNGTIVSLENSAMDSLRRNAVNHAGSLEDMMVHGMSNLDKLESDVISALDQYVRDYGITTREVLGNYEHETALLTRLSESLVGALRFTSATGIYIYLIGTDPPGDNEHEQNGLYYRDLDPSITPSDNSDILFLRGFVDIARKEKIQLDSLWSESFTFSPDNAGLWHEYTQTLNAALAHPEMSSADLSYWNRPHYINALSPLDSNECISYSRPVFYKDRLIAVIGTEMQMERLKKYFPANDFEDIDQAGYLLLHYNAEDREENGFGAVVGAASGSYIKRMVSAGERVSFKSAKQKDTYIAIGEEATHAAVEELKLYNTYSPFADEIWALAAIGTDRKLFESSRNASQGIFFGAFIAFLVGVVFIAIIIRISTAPLNSVVKQIQTRDPADRIDKHRSYTYEVSLLCDSINDTRYKRRLAEAELLEERERYLFALESAADTFMEYDAETDNLKLYDFVKDEKKPRLRESQPFKNVAASICHPDDFGVLMDFLAGKAGEKVELRIVEEFCPYIVDQEPDKGYFWFTCNASYVRDETGRVRSFIGIVRENTQEMLRKNALVEASRQDRTTGMYNREFGLRHMKKYAHGMPPGLAFAVCAVRVCDFERFEAHYGRAFGAAILNLLGRALRRTAYEGEIAVRLCNDEFLIFLPGAGREAVSARIGRLRAAADGLYVGENPDIKLTLRAGVAVSDGDADFSDVLPEAYRALQRADAPGCTVFAGESDTSGEGITYRSEPVGISLDVSKESIVGLTFDLFEKTTDIRSVIRMLLSMVGSLFSLRQILVCNYDTDFSANQVIYQWNDEGTLPYHEGIESVPREALEELECALDKNGALIYDTQYLRTFGENARKLLCTSLNEQVSAFACMLYESGTHLGRIIFKSAAPDGVFTPADQHSLVEISRIISAHISIDRSYSASRAKSEFLSRMSHEIRTPMNAIIGMTDIARKSLDDGERLGDCLEKIDFSARHLLGLINDVLEMSRIESGKMSLRFEPMRIGELIDAADKLMRPQIEGKGIAFETDCRVTDDFVVGDSPRIRQVLVNFLGNAFKFTEPGGVIRLEVVQTESDEYGLYRFSVKDSGAGISQEDQANVFKAFEQVGGSSVGKRREGTGLGLAISSGIIAAMDSRIELLSAPGMGSEFFFTLKLFRAEEAETPAARKETRMDFSGKRALLVEDNEINVEIASYILTERGLAVDVAHDGAEALRMFFGSVAGTYDIILMDIQMPVMDGLTATREIRRNRARPDAQTIPIVAMTADAFDEDMRRAIESGMNGHVAKPVDTGKLFAVLGELLPQKES